MGGIEGGTEDRTERADPYAMQAIAARAGLVRAIVAEGGLADPAWRSAFAEVPRHLFVPYYYVGGASASAAASAAGLGFERLWQADPEPERRWRWLAGSYADVPLATRVRDGELVSSSSQPSLMAQMLDALDVHGGERVLEIGAGTGYNAALLCHRLGEELVTTIDLDPEITEAARRHLAAAGYHPAVVTGDGARGCPARAPFDRILATCAVRTVPVPWLAQCSEDARVLAPLATGLILLRVGAGGGAQGRFLATPAYFVPLRGGPEPPAADLGAVPRRALRTESFRFLLTLTAGQLAAQEAYEIWEDAGRPGRERYGVTVRDGRQWSWLDDADGPYAWGL